MTVHDRPFRRGTVFALTCLQVIVAACSAGSDTTITVDFETSEGTKLAFDVAPDGQTIVFDLLGQLWSIPVGGGPATPITDAVREQGEDLDPAFSPGGESIVFRADRPGGRGLFLLSVANGEVQRLTDQPATEPAWSPEGDRLAFVQGRGIHLIRPGSEDPRELEIENLPGPAVSAPTWAPSGDRLAFVNAFAGSGGRLWSVSAGGGEATPLTEEGLGAKGPSYSPVDDRLAFFARDSLTRIQIWVMEEAGDPVMVTNQPDVTPLRIRWTPDGSKIVYHAEGRLWAVSPAGGDPSEIPFSARVQVTRKNVLTPETRFPTPGTVLEARGHMGLALAPGGSRIAMIALGRLWVFGLGEEPRSVAAMPPTAGGLSWSPDEETVAWSGGPGGGEDLFVTDVSTGRTRRITALPGSEMGPAWSPDGQQIAFIHWEKPALETPAHDYSDSSPRIRVIPSNGEPVATKEETIDLSDGFISWGFMGPSQDAPMWGPGPEPLLLFFAGGQGTLVSMTGDASSFQSSVTPTFLSWTHQGNLLYVEDGLLWSAPFDTDSLKVGDPSRLSDDPALYASTSRDGSVLFLSSSGLRILRPTGEVEDLGWPLSYQVHAGDRLLIRNVSVVPGTGAMGEGPVDILVEEGRILRIAPVGVLEADDGTQVLDGEGRVAIPGLIDLHAHHWDDAVLPAALFHGVTTIRDMGSLGVARLAGFRDGIEAGLFSGPRIVLGGVQFWGAGTLTGAGGYQVSGDSAIARAIDLMAAFRPDYLKTRLFDDWSGAAKLVEAAHGQGWPVSGHIALPLPLIAAGIDGMEHLGPSGFRTDEIVYDDQIQLFRHAGVWVVPTTVGYSSVPMIYEDPGLFEDPETASFTTPFLKWWAFRMPPGAGRAYGRFADFTRVSAGKLFQAGVTLAAGTDAPVLPWAMHTEMEELVAIGLSPLEAIRAGTQTAADILGAGSEVGSIEEGKWADLIILNEDPLEDIRNTRAIWKVIKAGSVVDRASLRGWVTQLPPGGSP